MKNNDIDLTMFGTPPNKTVPSKKRQTTDEEKQKIEELIKKMESETEPPKSLLKYFLINYVYGPFYMFMQHV